MSDRDYRPLWRIARAAYCDTAPRIHSPHVDADQQRRWENAVRSILREWRLRDARRRLPEIDQRAAENLRRALGEKS